MCSKVVFRKGVHSAFILFAATELRLDFPVYILIYIYISLMANYIPVYILIYIYTYILVLFNYKA